MEPVSENFENLISMEAEDVRTLYEQYSEWSRHLHSQIITLTTFGITISLGSLSLASDPTLSFTQFISVGIANLLLLVTCFSFAESVKNQQINFWAVIDYIEMFWKIRDSNNIDRPLIEFSRKYKRGATQKIRRNLFIIAGIFWVVAIIIKILSCFLKF